MPCNMPPPVLYLAESVSTSSHGYDKLTTCDDRHIGLTELGSGAAQNPPPPPPRATPAAAAAAAERRSRDDVTTPESEDFSLTDDGKDAYLMLFHVKCYTRRFFVGVERLQLLALSHLQCGFILSEGRGR